MGIAVLNIYLLAGFLSMFLITFAEKVQWAGVALVYIPALWCLYLLIFEGDPVPFISLAAGYIIAMPAIIIIATLTARSIWGMITSYIIGYAISLMLYTAVLNDFNTPEKIFLYLVSGFRNLFSEGERINLLAGGDFQQPDTTLLTPLTALATLGIILNLMTNSEKRTVKDEIIPRITGIAVLAITLILTTASSWISSIMPDRATLILGGLSAALLISLAIITRKGDSHHAV
ncbi:MAG: hypothetical protein NXY59_08230 [Aigarchaeota archaeon]|nr:hypothetical protein [Candidatus Pelearchaeum maunauluense]